ncbi:hypothetical protein FACS189467_6080 [Bacteroidia bacterium]|nr:hypothetical protein FACS189467_6080 [Bacteroidia bacterium]
MGGCQPDIVTYDNGYDDGLTPAGPPAISSIVLALDTAETPSGIEVAAMGDLITILGTNLSQVQSITFNGVPADSREWTAVNSYITVPIPREIISDEQAAQKKVVVTTSKGSAEYTLAVGAPKLLVDGFYNEFASAGDTIDIIGDNFDLFQFATSGKVKLQDGTDADTFPIYNVTRNILTVVIPKETLDGALISVTSDFYQEKTGGDPLTISFRENGFSLMSPENYENWDKKINHGTDGSNKGDPKPLKGLHRNWFIYVKGALKTQWIWGGGVNALGANANGYEAVVANPENYEVKFEILTRQPLAGKQAIGFEYNGKDEVFWEAGESVAFSTNGKWKTVRFSAEEIMLAKNIRSPNGNGTKKVVTSEYCGLGLDYSQAAGEPNVDFAICNFRVVPKRGDVPPTYEHISWASGWFDRYKEE